MDRKGPLLHGRLKSPSFGGPLIVDASLSRNIYIALRREGAYVEYIPDLYVTDPNGSRVGLRTMADEEIGPYLEEIRKGHRFIIYTSDFGFFDRYRSEVPDGDRRGAVACLTADRGNEDSKRTLALRHWREVMDILPGGFQPLGNR